MNPSSSSISVPESLKKELAAFADQSLTAAQRHVVDPVAAAARRTSAQARQAIHEAKDVLSEQTARASRYAADRYDHTSAWAASNPWRAIGISFAAGMVISAIIGATLKR